MKIRSALALAAIGLSSAAIARSHGANYVYATYDECVADGEFGLKDGFTYVCVPTANGGWELVWTHLKRVHG